MSHIGVDNDSINRLREEKLPIKYERDLNEYYIQLSIPRSLFYNLVRNLAKLHRAFIGLRIGGIKGFENEINITLKNVEREALETMIKVISVLEKYGIDNIWYSIFINHFLAIIAAEKKFDLVLGNLPWVNVSKYPRKYSEKLKKIAKELGVNPPREAAKKLDISVILYVISAKYLLKQGGVLGLMVPASIFRGLHGSGWRSFFIEKR